MYSNWHTQQIYNNNKSARNRIWSHKVDTGVHKSTHILQKKNYYYFYLMDTSEIQYTMPHQVSLSNKSVCMSAISCPISLAMHSVVFVLWLVKAVSRKSHQILFDPWCEKQWPANMFCDKLQRKKWEVYLHRSLLFCARQLILILHSHKKPGIYICAIKPVLQGLLHGPYICDPYKSMLSTQALKKASFVDLGMLDYQMGCNLLRASQACPLRIIKLSTCTIKSFCLSIKCNSYLWFLALHKELDLTF